MDNAELQKCLEDHKDAEHLKIKSLAGGKDNATLLADFLKSNHTLESLQLITYDLNEAELVLLSDALKTHPRLCRLVLDVNMAIDTENADSARQMLPILEVLAMNSSLKSVSLIDNGLDDTSMLELGYLLDAKHTLAKLCLADNQITSEGARYLFEALKTNRSLQVLDISGNKIEDTGVRALCQCLRENLTLASVKLNVCGVTSGGLYDLSQHLKDNHTLQALDISYNAFDEGMVNHFLESLQSNVSLKKIDLTGLNLTYNCGLNIIKLLKHNETLTEICLEENPEIPIGFTKRIEAKLSCNQLKHYWQYDPFNAVGITKALKTLQDFLKNNAAQQELVFPEEFKQAYFQEQCRFYEIFQWVAQGKIEKWLPSLLRTSFSDPQLSAMAHELIADHMLPIIETLRLSKAVSPSEYKDTFLAGHQFLAYALSDQPENPLFKAGLLGASLPYKERMGDGVSLGMLENVDTTKASSDEANGMTLQGVGESFDALKSQLADALEPLLHQFLAKELSSTPDFSVAKQGMFGRASPSRSARLDSKDEEKDEDTHKP